VRYLNRRAQYSSGLTRSSGTMRSAPLMASRLREITRGSPFRSLCGFWITKRLAGRAGCSPMCDHSFVPLSETLIAERTSTSVVLLLRTVVHLNLLVPFLRLSSGKPIKRWAEKKHRCSSYRVETAKCQSSWRVPSGGVATPSILDSDQRAFRPGIWQVIEAPQEPSGYAEDCPGAPRTPTSLPLSPPQPDSRCLETTLRCPTCTRRPDHKRAEEARTPL